MHSDGYQCHLIRCWGEVITFLIVEFHQGNTLIKKLKKLKKNENVIIPKNSKEDIENSATQQDWKAKRKVHLKPVLFYLSHFSWGRSIIFHYFVYLFSFFLFFKVSRLLPPFIYFCVSVADISSGKSVFLSLIFCSVLIKLFER